METEAIRIFSTMRGWVPGTVAGVPVDCYVRYVVNFGMRKDKVPERLVGIFKVVEVMPEYPGGMAELYSYLNKNIRIPKAEKVSIEGKVVRVRFIVRKEGSITDAEVVRSAGKALDKEALRVIKRMPKWKPGKNNGMDVSSYFNLPIRFEK